eukprot:TRINITY_DN5305_c0_g1_i1.p1 TRINITY_DN5305_c0_g1~~TRINITY_DN5305_c0_g1_i1.p1  ORF type:complete len:610 (-),score=168.92 TRINITY_DN5305_c0_g1_i1:99-1865(-)
MKKSLTFLILLITLKLATSDPCADIPTCAECVAETYCGWCSTNIIFENGQRGTNCAFQGKDATPFFCNGIYQTETCIPDEYKCNNQTFQCEKVGYGEGDEIDVCLSTCFPPVYVCNEQTSECEEAKPGELDATSLDVCEASCGIEPPEEFVCDPDTLECRKANEGESGSTTQEACEEACGKTSNSTPAAIIGNWRGLEVDIGYKEGEWRMEISEEGQITINNPDGKIFAEGQILTMQSELWIETRDGIFRGLWAVNQLPTVTALTWALGGEGLTVPPNFDIAMEDSAPGTVFTFFKCLDESNCEFSQTLLKRYMKELKVKELLAQTGDQCTVHETCEECIGDESASCGWCSVNVLYKNGTVEGTQCAGHNSDGSKEPFICNGAYSTESCTIPDTKTSDNTATADDTATSDNTATADDTATADPDDNKKYTCNPTTLRCEEDSNGNYGDNATCVAQCVSVPITPADLLGSWRGLQINQNYITGEWLVDITEDNVTIVRPDGDKVIGHLEMIGQYLTIFPEGGSIKGNIQTLWQVTYGPVTKFLGWAWGEPNGAAPESFQSAMTASNNAEFVFVSCLTGKPERSCLFRGI